MKLPKWPVVRLGSIAEFRNGLNYNKDNFGTGLKVINVKDFQDRLIADFTALDEINPEGLVRDECFIRDGDILFVRSNGNRELIGRSMLVAGVKEKISHSAFSIKARFNTEDVLPRFYAYLFRTSLIRKELSNRGGGTNISNLNQDILNSLDVPKPPLPTQRKISGILSAYDDLIENNSRRIAILEQMAQSIYREWFVNFRFPGHQNVKLVDSPLGKIPEGWKVVPFSEAAEFLNGFAFKPEHWGDNGFPIVKIAELKNGITQKTPRNSGEGIPNKYLVNTGDVLFSWSADLDAYIWTHERGLLNQHIFSVQPFDSYKKEYLFFALKASMQKFQNMSLGTTMKHIKRSALNQVFFAKPSNAIQSDFANQVSSMIQHVININKAIFNLRQTRDLLLPKLISGQLDVEDLEIDTGEPLEKAPTE